MRLVSVLPEFALELESALNDLGESDLANSISSLEIVERCQCNEQGCVTFHAVPKSNAPSGDSCTTIVAPMMGVSCVQYYNDQIVWIEALGRPKEREILHAYQAMPKET